MSKKVEITLTSSLDCEEVENLLLESLTESEAAELIKRIDRKIGYMSFTRKMAKYFNNEVKGAQNATS